MTRIHSTKDALTAQMFEDFDTLVTKVEAVLKSSIELDRQLQATTQALDANGDRYRMAVTAFTEQAKAELSEHVQRATQIVMTQKADEIHMAMQKAARSAFEAQSWDTAGALADRLKGAASEFRRGIWSRLIENGIVALLAGILASAMTYGLTSH